MFSSIAPATASGARTPNRRQRTARKKLRRNEPDETRVTTDPRPSKPPNRAQDGPHIRRSTCPTRCISAQGRVLLSCSLKELPRIYILLRRRFARLRRRCGQQIHKHLVEPVGIQVVL